MEKEKLSFYQDLANLQQAIEPLKKSKQAYGYKYTPLDVINDYLQPLLKANNFIIVHSAQSDNERQYVVTNLIHVTTGVKLDSVIEIPMANLKGQNEFQTLGSAITYFRRYNTECLLNLTTTEDNDAQKPAPKKKINDFAAALQSVKDGKVTAEQVINVYNLTAAQIKQLKECK